MAIVRIKRVGSASFLNEVFTVYDGNAQSRIGPYKSKAGWHTGLNKEEETQFEKDLGLDAGKLGKMSTFWDDFFVSIKGKNAALNDELPLEGLYLKVLKAHPIVANSAHEFKNTRPTAGSEYQFVIVEAESEAKAENETFKYKKKAHKLLDPMTIDEMRQVLLVMGKPAYSIGNEQVENLISKEIDRDPKQFIAVTEDPNFKTKLFIQQCVGDGILEKRGNTFYYGGESITHSLGEMVDYLTNKDNNNFLLVLKQATAAKKKNKV